MTHQAAIDLFHNDVVVPFIDLADLIISRKYDGGGTILRQAKNVSMNLYHFFELQGKESGCSYNKIRRSTKEVVFIHDIATLAKHGSLRRKESQVTNLNQLQPALETVKYRDAIGDYIHVRPRLLLHIEKDQYLDYLELLAISINAVSSFLGAERKNTFKQVQSPPVPDFVLREDASEQLESTATLGITFHIPLHFKRYDNVLGKVVPSEPFDGSLEFTANPGPVIEWKGEPL